RYIELNAVRAGMVTDPAHYRWTSFGANALGQSDSNLTPHPLYVALGASAQERRTAHRALFCNQLDRAAIDDIRLALNQNQQLGLAYACGRLDLRGIACVLADQRSGDRRAHRDLALLDIGFIVADDLVGHCLAGRQILEIDRCAENDLSAGIDLGRIDDVRV